MSLTAGSGDEVLALAKKIHASLRQILAYAEVDGKRMLDELSRTAQDKSYGTAESIVQEVKSIVTGAAPECAEVYKTLQKYAVFLDGMQDG